MNAVATVEPTEQELRAAWARLRTSPRTTWPDTFEAAMADPVFAGLVRLNAKHPPRAGHAPAERDHVPAREPARAEPRAFPLPGIKPAIDRKRAAAGERDDD